MTGKIALVIYNSKIMLAIIEKMSALKDFHSLPGILCGIVLYVGCVAWKSRHVGQFLTISPMSAFMLI